MKSKAKVVVVGGVRRSALISLSSIQDDQMRKAKSGQWWLETVSYTHLTLPTICSV